MLTDKNNKNYSNEHPKGKKPTEEENIKLAKKSKLTIKIDPMEFKIMDEAAKEAGGDFQKYKKLFYKKFYDYKRSKDIKIVK